MKEFNVFLYDFNKKQETKLNIMPYLLDTYFECQASGHWWPLDHTDKEPISYNEYSKFVKNTCMYRYWARCEYEWLMLGWPPGNTDTLEGCQKTLNKSRKIDVWQQIQLNFDLVVDLFIENLKLSRR
jgi:hypothetical protein